MKILITGGNGFIARSLKEGLNRGHQLIVLNRQQLDLCDSSAVRELLKQEKFDAVIHCANYDAAPKTSVKNPNAVLENNLKMFFSLARCSEYFGRMIYFGSGAEFGREYWQPKMSEEYFDCHVPQDQYGFSKYLMTRYALKTDKIFNLRLFGVYGEYDDWHYRFLPNICARLALGLPLVIRQNRKFDWLYIKDLVKACDWLLTYANPKKVYNLCTGTVKEAVSLAEYAASLAGVPFKPIIRFNGIGTEYGGDSTLLVKDSGLKFTSAENGIKNLYAYYNSNKNLLNKNEILNYPI